MDSGVIPSLAAGVESDDPLEALASINELHRELDALEAITVRRARNAGASWQLVAASLGVSRQAVHKKYGRA
jgi:DNA invertase Pin-like site-specific DNA recombinase